MTITGAGLVGIGAAPKSALDVSGGMAIGRGYAGIVAAPANGLIVQGGIGIGTTTISATNSIMVTKPDYHMAYFQSTGANNSVVTLDNASSGNFDQIWFNNTGSEIAVG